MGVTGHGHIHRLTLTLGLFSLRQFSEPPGRTMAVQSVKGVPASGAPTLRQAAQGWGPERAEPRPWSPSPQRALSPPGSASPPGARLTPRRHPGPARPASARCEAAAPLAGAMGAGAGTLGTSRAAAAGV